MRLRTLIAIAVTMCALPALAAELPTAPEPRAVPARVTKVYSVLDLVDHAKDKEGERLVKLVKSMVRPYSWDDAGGRGIAEYFDLGSALVVTNTADVQQEVSDLLEALGRLQAAAPASQTLNELLLALVRPRTGAPIAPAPREANRSAVVKLRNAAAADAAHALNAFLKARKLDAVVTAEPVSNTVHLSAEPAIQQQLLDILTALDKEPVQVILQVLVMEVSKDFVEQSGLNIGAAPGATSWVLTERERHMFNAIIRDAKAHNQCEVLSRPNVQLYNNQPGVVQIGQDFPFATADGKIETVRLGSALRATPRVAPDGRVVLNYEMQLAELSAPVVSKARAANGDRVSPTTIKKRSCHETAELKPGETLVTRLGDKLVIITPSVLK